MAPCSSPLFLSFIHNPPLSFLPRFTKQPLFTPPQSPALAAAAAPPTPARLFTPLCKIKNHHQHVIWPLPRRRRVHPEPIPRPSPSGLFAPSPQLCSPCTLSPAPSSSTPCQIASITRPAALWCTKASLILPLSPLSTATCLLSFNP